MIASKRANQARVITKELVKKTESAVSDQIKVEKLAAQEVEEKYQVLIDCVDEKQQVELLKKLRKDGLECKALIS